MISKLLFPDYMDLSKPCLSCKYYSKRMTKQESLDLIERKKREGIVLEYEYGMKYCLYQKQFVFFNWNCEIHEIW